MAARSVDAIHPEGGERVRKMLNDRRDKAHIGSEEIQFS
jgi:hypothetical protein